MADALMVDNSDLSDFSPREIIAPPGWLPLVPPLYRMWYGPVFQRYLKRSQLRLYLAPKPAFAAGIAYSVLADGVFILLYCYMEDFRSNIVDNSLAFVIAVLSLPAVIIGVEFFLMFYACLVKTSIAIKIGALEGKEDPVLATPVSDSELYSGSCLPNFMKGLMIVESIVYLTIGLAIPSIPGIIIVIVGGGLTVSQIVPWTVVFLGFVLLTLLSFILMTLLLSLAVGLYSSYFQLTGVIIAALMHYWFVTQTAYILTILWPFYYFVSDGYEMTWGTWMCYLVIEFLKRAWIAAGCVITWNLGVAAVRRRRRRVDALSVTVGH